MFNLILNSLKKIIPVTIFNFLRKILTGIFTPFIFSFSSGHFISSIKAKAVDKNNKPIPWYTYPCIDFLNALSLKDKTILEFGSGQSSIWWSKNSFEVFALEDNQHYFDELKKLNIKNLNIKTCDTNLNNFKDLNLNDNFFDIIVIDGFDRYLSFKNSLKLIKHDGIFIFDNSEGYHEPRDDYGSYPILKLMHHRGYNRIDFYGYAPGVIKKHCTSIFHMNNSFINKLNLKIKRF